MPEINRVKFKYEPVDGSFLLDGFRMAFYTERLDDIKDALQYLQFAHRFTRPIEGEIRFTDAACDPPVVRDIRYSHYADRKDKGRPMPGVEFTLWPANDE